MPKAFFIDTTRCTACRACQVICKEWHNLPANQTKQLGTHQNPLELNPYNFKVVRFNEWIDDDGNIQWKFFPDQCRHCIRPICMFTANQFVKDAIIRDEETGAVLVTEKCSQINIEDLQTVILACPYFALRYDSEKKIFAKCNMCIDRLKAGKLPACVEVCPTGAMSFGDREAILQKANERLEKIKQKYPNAILYDPNITSVIYLLTADPLRYHDFATFLRKKR